jgi:hypothetical protein
MVKGMRKANAKDKPKNVAAYFNNEEGNESDGSDDSFDDEEFKDIQVSDP